MAVAILAVPERPWLAIQSLAAPPRRIARPPASERGLAVVATRRGFRDHQRGGSRLCDGPPRQSAPGRLQELDRRLPLSALDGGRASLGDQPHCGCTRTIRL